tara:strand:- start:15774 stop:16478 length:705 start_codon:yes stop_codon:yes gene_type:complete
MEENHQQKENLLSKKTINIFVGIYCVVWFLNSNSIPFWLIVSIPLIGLIFQRISNQNLTSIIKIDADKKDYNVPEFIMFPTLTIMLRLVLSFELESWKRLLPYSMTILIFILLILFIIFKLPKVTVKKLLLALGPTIFTLFLFSYFSAYGINIYFDNSTPKVHQSVVIDKEESRGTGKAAARRTYYAIVEPWGTFTEPNKIMISRTEFDSIQPGDVLEIERHQGYFGVPWFKSI